MTDAVEPLRALRTHHAAEYQRFLGLGQQAPTHQQRATYYGVAEFHRKSVNAINAALDEIPTTSATAWRATQEARAYR